MKHTTAIWWLRRDLRLSDNQALTAAARATNIIPLFIIDPVILNADTYSANRFAFLLAGLHSLNADLEQRGSHLVIRQGDTITELQRISAEVGATAIFAEEDVTPYARRRDAAVRAAGLPLTLTPGLTVQRPDAVRKADGTPYTVFTPFSRAWHVLPQAERVDLLPSPQTMGFSAEITSLPIPDYPTLPPSVPFKAGEAEAQRRLQAFIRERVFAYGDQRNRMDIDGTSRLSPYLRFGMLSARTAVITAQEAIADAATEQQRKNATTFLTELIWREFYQSILHDFPYVRRGNFRSDYDNIAWINDPDDFQAWCDGVTGVPVVDAAMRQLRTTGWMHNRARMIVASFLTKNLLIDWRWGERWFMQNLIDGDLAANNGGWQWTAGTGTDAAPYFRIFNPVTQSSKFDPDGEFIRRWVPELAAVENKFLHAPWEMSPADQKQCGVIIGRNYPAPFVDLKLSRQRALDTYKAGRE
ncbi:MAG: DNA photolyase family protein [Anaerolineae bacterium]|nr:DNA photolyase family protein [Anaerolineae bacterium]